MSITNSVALLSVAVVDGHGGPPLPNHAVVVTAGRITAVVPMAQYRRDPDIPEQALDGHWVMPGLIDAHVHLSGGRARIEDQELGVIAEPMLMRAVRSVYEAQQLLKRGVTTVRDVSWNGLYLKRLFSEHTMPGPKVIACGPGLTRTGGHADLHQFTPDYVQQNGVWGILADGRVEVTKAVRYLLREGADAIKIFASGGDNWPHDRNDDVHYSFDEISACVEEAHRQRGTLVMCHAENREAIELAVDAGCDTIEHGEDIDEALAAKMAAKGTILVPTLELIVNWYRDFIPVGPAATPKPRPDAFLYRDHYDVHDEGYAERYSSKAVQSFQIARAAGVKIALGSDTVYEPLTQYGEYSLRELCALVQYGMTTQEAITAATAVSAQAVGMSHVLGTVTPGMLADLLVLRRDPTGDPGVLYDVTNIFQTYCDGKLTVRDGQFVW
ncbi:amidohydrolase family protein [Mycolicibacterium sp. 018/SC-01/001]|uniref:metal-dependent hydrolase family protein n=1 Tax=Mycolicibacterium sp. 018/SC-01/001 TaxID=2592069 RepID=UPI00117FA60A|nr:amidohydrolase family protein [Mycolicibacterium sp. 018/SC-01/001]TRW80977.1 amidohydrolase family protein [Mycolicibacterium sp. 018/SC-01/001]